MKPCIYCTFDLEDYKYYIGYQSNADKIKRKEYIGSSSDENGPNAENLDLDPERFFVTILGYFATENEGYAAETDLQTFMNAADDSNSYNRSNDSFKKGSEAKQNLVQRLRTWFFPSAARSDKMLSDSELKSMSRYIKKFSYTNPEHYPTPITTITENDEPEEMKELNLNAFITGAREDCYNRGYNVGAFPNEDKYNQELDVLKIELEQQLSNRIFTLEQALVEIEAEIPHTPRGATKFVQLHKNKAKIEHQIKWIETKVEGEEWLKTIQASFQKGYIQRIEDNE